MRTLTNTLQAAQKASTRIPAVSVQARNLISGVVNLKWNRLYTGTEPDGPHALTLAGDGSMIRLRITPVSNNRKLYRQRVTGPGPGSDFSQWSNLNLYNVINCAACSMGNEVSLVWVRSNGAIEYQKSLDCGATWQNIEYPGYAPVGQVSGLAAAYRNNGDLAIFFTDTATLYITKRIAGVWQSREAWDKATGDLTGVATVYDGDWKLLVCGQDTVGNFRIWSLVYGDAGEFPAGTWSDPKEIASAPSDGAYEFNNLFLDKPDTYRCFYVEKFTGNEAYNRPFWSHTLPETGFLENRWREPVPFETEGPNGLAIAHSGGYAWLSMPSGIWRASLAEQTLDLSGDILMVKSDVRSQESEYGKLTVELRNINGRYSDIGQPQGAAPMLDIGCQIDFKPGYQTPEGNEYSTGLSFTLQEYEHIDVGGKASLVLYAADGWTNLENWIARYQFRWNKPDQYGEPAREAPVKEILTQILARSGLKLEVITQSAVITGFYPDFTIHPGDKGRSAVTRLLSFIPDVFFLEGNTAYLINPLTTDNATYTYGTEHAILEGRYRSGAWKINRVRVEGVGVLADSFAWPEIQKQGDILELLEDLNLITAVGALDRGGAHLRQAEMESIGGYLRIPVNCGQQLYDVIAITDPRTGLAGAKRRILGITLVYQPAQAEYEQKLILGGI